MFGPTASGWSVQPLHISQRQWTQSSSRKVEQPQGEVQAENPVNEPKLDTGALKAKTIQTKCRKVAGRLVRQPVKEKIDFISLQ